MSPQIIQKQLVVSTVAVLCRFSGFIRFNGFSFSVSSRSLDSCVSSWGLRWVARSFDLCLMLKPVWCILCLFWNQITPHDQGRSVLLWNQLSVENTCEQGPITALIWAEMSSKPIFAEKEDCKKNWHEIPADFSVKVFLQPKFRQKQKQHLSKIINETPRN